jgi:hypothetical protein
LRVLAIERVEIGGRHARIAGEALENAAASTPEDDARRAAGVVQPSPGHVRTYT